MFTTEASYAVPISISIVLFIISMALYLHDIVLMDASVKEAVLMWENNEMSEEDIKQYLSNRNDRIYVLTQTDYVVSVNDTEIHISYSSKDKKFYSVIYLLLSREHDKTIEFKASAEKTDYSDNLRRVYSR